MMIGISITYEHRKKILQSYKTLSLSIKTVEDLVVLLNSEQKKYASVLMNADEVNKYNIEIKSLISSLGNLLDEKNEICQTILLKINQMDSEVEKNILTLKYISGYTWEKISEMMNYSLRQVYNIHNNALNHFDT